MNAAEIKTIAEKHMKQARTHTGPFPLSFEDACTAAITEALAAKPSAHTGVIVGVDDTDHLDFICQCGAVMLVTNVQTTGVLRRVRMQEAETHVYVKCPKCNNEHWRKFRWQPATTNICPHRTDGK